MDKEQQSVIDEFNRECGWGFDPRIGKDEATLTAMAAQAAEYGRHDLAGRLTRLREQLHPRSAVVARCQAAVRDFTRPKTPDAKHHTQISVADFRRLLAEAQDELQVRRIVLYYQEHLTGTAREINEALDYAGLRAMELQGEPVGELVGR
jgi:hypothetical protein